jgi:lysophospholipase L1-like esterase
MKIIATDDPHLIWAPYVWKMTGTGSMARAEAAIPGAYGRVSVQGTSKIGLVIDGTANDYCPPAAMPILEYSVDEAQFQAVRLTRTGEVYTLSLAEGLDAAQPHRVTFLLRATDLGNGRWASTMTHLRVAGLALDATGSLLPTPVRAKRAIGFGDSITEGVGVDGLFQGWPQSLDVNNARGSWFPVVCAALDCEYGQLGSSGQGMVRPIEMPPLPQTWDHFDAATSRLTGGLLLPEPDYLFCCMGTNDAKDLAPEYIRWLIAVRKACPHMSIFCIAPPLGCFEEEVESAVAARRQAGDSNVHLINATSIRSQFRVNTGATTLGYDGVHPSMYGNAILGAVIAVQAQRALDQRK